MVYLLLHTLQTLRGGINNMYDVLRDGEHSIYFRVITSGHDNPEKDQLMVKSEEFATNHTTGRGCLGPLGRTLTGHQA